MKQSRKQQDAYRRALKEIGTAEVPGDGDNEKIIRWFEKVGHSWVRDDETAWCAAFLGAMLEYSGIRSTRKLNARSYLDWGRPVDLEDAVPGDVVVFWRKNQNSWEGHVGFYCAHNSDTVHVLGGNQANKVSIAYYPRAKLLGVRRLPEDEEKLGVLATLLGKLLDLIRGLK